MAEVATVSAQAQQNGHDKQDDVSYVLSPASVEAVQPEELQHHTQSTSGEAAAAISPAAGTASVSNAKVDAAATHAQAVATNALLQNSRKETVDFEQTSQDAFYDAIDPNLKKGTAMLKVSAKKVQRRLVRIKPEAGQLLWESKHAGILNIESIRELRFGPDARGFREQFKVAPDCESRWISIIYTSSGRYKILHLVALTAEDFKLWRQTLQTLYDQRKELMGGLDQMRKRQSVWLKQHWSNADINEDQKLDLKDVETLCKNLNISASEKAIRTNFERADIHKRGFLDFSDFQLFVKYLRRRPEIEDLMRSISGSSESVDPAAFKTFLRKTQMTTLPDTTIDALYAKFSESKQDSMGVPMRLMTTDGFTSFLMSSDNMAFSERQLKVCDDMTRPLCEYYISSSHNTYLVGSQLKGDSTSEGYIRALQQGCRSVELDVWDGPDEPVVYHGRTLTSRLPAREALTAIAKYAFVASPYPVILSMEVHCDHAQQDKLAEILKSTLGKSLVSSPLFGETINEHLAGAPTVEKLPSPENLKYRILVKAKNLFVIKQSSSSANARRGSVDLASEDDSSSTGSSDSDIKKAFSSALRMIRPGPSSPSISPPALANKHTSSYPLPTSHATPAAAPLERQLSARASTRVDNQAVVGGGSVPTPSTFTTTGSGSMRDGRRLSLARLRSRSDTSTTSSLATTKTSSTERPVLATHDSGKKDKPLMSLSLAALLVYTIGVKWRGLNKKEQYEASHIVSLGERRANKIIKESRKELISHCRTHLIRSYPAGTRFFTSSNYLPIFYWSVGIQLVSLNWQTYDLGMEINMSFFNRNGRCGFVLKPDLLRFKKGNEKDSSISTSASSSGGGHGTGILGGIIGSISTINQNEKDKEAIKKLESYVLEIEILSAQQLPRPRLHDPSTTLFTESDSTEKQLSSSNIVLPINPFVEVMVFTPTIPKDDISAINKYKTDAVLGNGFNPVFSHTTPTSTSTSSEGSISSSNATGGGGKFKIPFTTTLDGLDLAFLRVEVLAKVAGEEMSLGKYTVSLPVLMPGYRHIPLYDHLGQQYLFSSLFIYTRLHKLPG